MAVDLGKRRVGIAMSDRDRTMAFPLRVVERTGDPGSDRRALAALARQEGASVVVVGLPLSLDGGSGPAARAAADEAQELAELLGPDGVRVETFDERLTTVSAEAAMARAGVDARRRRRSVDAAAATVLLQAWLDAR
jgi:putative Holliday junction resolvase